jgi:hypothetical protein
MIVLFLLAFAGPALAQGSGGETMPTGLGLALGIFFTVVAAIIVVVRWVAPKTENTIDDRVRDALTWLQEKRSKVEETVDTG